MGTSPNVLCISIDSLRADFCSVYSEGTLTTPNLAALADEGTVCRNAVSPSTWTLPVHTSVFTGLYPPEHQVIDKDIELGAHPTFGELFYDVGYETKSFGWNGWLEQDGVLRGFEHHRTPDVPQFRKGFIGYFDRAYNKISELLFRHQLRDNKTVDNVRNQLSSSNEPFCYFIHLNSAHWPYHPPAPFHKTFSDRPTPELSWNLVRQRRLYERRGEIYSGQYDVSDRTINAMRELYRGSVHYCDRLVGQIFDFLSDEGLDERTIVVVFGDHGDNIGEEGLFGHHFSVSDSVVKVPLVISDPTDQLTTNRVQKPTQLTDIYPTLLDLSGLDIPETRSYSLLNEEGRDAAFVYYETPPSFLERMRRSGFDEQLPASKRYVIWRGQSDRLTWFPQEGDFEFDGPEAEADELVDELNSHFDSLEPVSTGAESSLPEDVRANLEQMGYL